MTTEAPTHDDPLSLAFMRGHPAQAARVLEALPATQATELFERVPARIGAAVLAAMLPPWAARCLGPLDDERILELFAPMGMQPAVAVLRHLPDPRRRIIAAGLPTAVGLASALLLGYEEDTLGAWADPDVVMLPSETRVADALAHLRQATSPHPMVFVASTDRRLLGLVGHTAMLQAPQAATLATLMQRPAAMLPAHTPLAATPSHPGWAHASALPVVAAGNRLLGVMTRDALTRALRQAGVASGTRAPASEGSLAHTLAGGYWQVLSGLLGVALALLPRVPPLRPAPEGEVDDGR